MLKDLRAIYIALWKISIALCTYLPWVLARLLSNEKKNLTFSYFILHFQSHSSFSLYTYHRKHQGLERRAKSTKLCVSDILKWERLRHDVALLSKTNTLVFFFKFYWNTVDLQCCFWRVYHNGCWILSKALSVSIEMIMWFLLFNLLMWYIILIDLWILKNPCISEDKEVPRRILTNNPCEVFQFTVIISYSLTYHIP